MKKIIQIAIMITCVLFSGYVEGHAATVTKQAAKTTKQATKARKTDKTIIKEYCRKNFPGYRVRIRPAEETTDAEIAGRKGKKMVYVDIFKTRATSRTGGRVTTKGPFYGNRIQYAHKARKGQRVTVYYLYNPETGYTDDIIATVSGGKIRTE